ncbi:MAG: AmmeMemoRadiSam system protein B [Elusimicrobiota bacterium]
MIKILIFYLITLLFSDIGPYVNGKFYPDKKEDIENFIKNSFEKTKSYKKLAENLELKAIISPHAGYQFSGRLMAISYSVINGTYESFIIISPSHRVLIDGAITCDEDFLTPLGKVEVDQEFIKILKENKLFKIDKIAFENEHAIEVQLPFIQYKFKKTKIIPILVNTQDVSQLIKIAEEIKNTIEKTKRKVFIIISSDFSHYPDYETAHNSDRTAIEAIKTMNEQYFDLTQKMILSKNIKNLNTIACGSSAIIVGIRLSKLLGANTFTAFENKNSNDENPIYSSKESVVGYISGAFVYDKNITKKQEKLETEERKYLLKKARNSIESYLKGDKNIIESKLEQNPKLNLPKAVFVTITENGYLRGCMGSTEPRLTLSDAVGYFAVVAGFNDPRFSPLKAEELKKIKIEISILSPMKKINSIDEIKQKQQGVVVVSSKGSGLFLPQVWDYFNTKEDFLGELCQQKAGLERNCWKDKNTQLFTFTVEKFEE